MGVGIGWGWMAVTVAIHTCARNMMAAKMRKAGRATNSRKGPKISRSAWEIWGRSTGDLAEI